MTTADTPRRVGRPGVITTAVAAWFGENPGFHRCCNVAPLVGYSTHQVATACWALEAQGRLIRQAMTPAGRKSPLTFYAAATMTNGYNPAKEHTPA